VVRLAYTARAFAKDTALLELSTLELAALLWFAVSFIGYAWLADHTVLHRRSVSAAMASHRYRWMRMMLERDMRMVDTAVQGNLLTSVGFFASTTIFVIAGLLASLGATDEAIEVMQALPLAAPTTRQMWELKVLLLVALFVYAFFKFAWSFRLFNYCSVLIAAAPPPPVPDRDAHVIAQRAAQVNVNASRHFNRGLRSYFFALAALGWFVNAVAFIVTTTWVLWIVYRREFRSHAYYSLKEPDTTPP
jgi:uncharacterized membrane protein